MLVSYPWLNLFSWDALYYSFAIVPVPIERDLGWDKATVNGAWSIGLLFTGLAAFPVGIFLDRLGGRIIMTGSTLLGVACLLLWSNTEHLSTLYVVCIGLGIAMSGSLYEAGFGVLTRRFPTTYTDQISRLTLVGGLAPTIFVVMSSLSQRRPRAIDDMRRARFSDRIARASCGGTDAGTRISRRRLSGVLCHGTFSTRGFVNGGEQWRTGLWRAWQDSNPKPDRYGATTKDAAVGHFRLAGQEERACDLGSTVETSVPMPEPGEVRAVGAPAWCTSVGGQMTL